MQGLNGPINSFERSDLLGGVASLSHLHRVPPTVRVHPLSFAVLPFSLEVSKIREKICFRELHDNIRSKGLDGAHRSSVVQAPRYKIPLIQRLGFPDGEAAPERLREELECWRRHDLRGADVDPVVWAWHGPCPFIVAPDVCVLVPESRLS